MKKLYFATGNKGKVEEAREILKTPIEILDVELDEIQSLSAKKVIKHKVLQAFEIVKAPVFVDDVSLEIEVWKKFPGPFIKYIRDVGGNDLLLYMMRNEKNRNVKLLATIGYHDGERVHTFIGRIEGTLAGEERGKNGWGFDPVLIPNGETETFAQMETRKKNKLSHRRRALDMLKKFLDKQNKNNKP